MVNEDDDAIGRCVELVVLAHESDLRPGCATGRYAEQVVKQYEVGAVVAPDHKQLDSVERKFGE
jgi:hypothetical protein